MVRGKFLRTAGVMLAAIGFFLSGPGEAQALTPIEELGEKLYFDANLSQPPGQSCASCHDPNFGFVDPDAELPVSEGVLPNRFGGRNSPSAGYAMFAPPLHFDEAEGLWIGGQFWDGRATGGVLDDPLADQALGPFLNPVEMHNKKKKQVVRDVAKSDYAGLFKEVWGADSFDKKNVEQSYDNIALSIAAFERTPMFAPFTSKYDQYLKECLENSGKMNKCAQGKGRIARQTGREIFTRQEWRGLKLFMGENNNDGIAQAGEGSMCAACHVAEWTEDPGNVALPDWAPAGFVPPMFTDFTYDNIGVPKNVEFPLSPTAPLDPGLGTVTTDPDDIGKFKVMSLRNIGLTGPYAHNGLFKTLKEVTHFYNTRDVLAAGWPEPEYGDTMNETELGNLALSEEQEDDIVSFLMTLSDQ